MKTKKMPIVDDCSQSGLAAARLETPLVIARPDTLLTNSFVKLTKWLNQATTGRTGKKWTQKAPYVMLQKGPLPP